MAYAFRWTWLFRLSASAVVAGLVAPTATYAFEDEAVVIERSLNHALVQGVQRGIGQRIRSAVVNSRSFNMQSAQLNGGGGLAAGEGAIGDVAVWLSGEYLTFDDDAGGIDTDADVWTGMVGADLVVNERFLLGMTAGLTNGNTTSTYQVFDVPGISTSDVDADSVTLAPYAAIIFNDNVYVGLHAGAMFIQNDTASAGGGFSSRGEHSTYGYFLGGDVNYVTAVNGFEMIGFAGGAWSTVEADAYANQAVPASDQGIFGGETSQNTRLSVGGQAGYPFNIRVGQPAIRVTPYLQAVAEFYVEPVARGGTSPLFGSPEPVEDSLDLRLTLGMDAALGDAFVGSLELGTVLFREDYSEFFASANLRFTF